MKTYGQRSVVFMALLSNFVSHDVFARQLSANEALEYAVGSRQKIRLASNATNMPAASAQLAYTVTTGNEPTVYVFSDARNGFLICAANDAVPTGLLGYTDNANIDFSNIPENVSWFLERYGRQIAACAAVAESVENIDPELSETTGARHAIAPMLTTKWGQSEGYNRYTPVVDGAHCPTGCIATAMGQMMAYYKFPVSGTGKSRYKASAIGQYIEYNFDEHPFDWESMFTPDGKATSEENSDAISQLLYACGMATRMNYSLSGSGSNGSVMARAMVDYFGYDKGMAYLARDYFTTSDWDEMIYSELESGRPVVYCGTSGSSGGHSFICDGCDGGAYYHINWGWNGCCDGYFLLTALDPYGDNAGFNRNEYILTGIQPATKARTTTAVRPVISFISDLSFGSMEIERDPYGDLNVRGEKGILNESVSALTVTFGLKLTDEEGMETYVSSKKSIKMICGQAITGYVLRHRDFPASGRYKATPAVKGEDGQWHDIYFKRDAEKAYYVECTAKTLTFIPESEYAARKQSEDITVTYLAVKSGEVTGSTFDIEAHFNNTSINHYTKYITPTLMADGETVASGAKLEIKVSANSQSRMEWVCTLDEEVRPGLYEMALIDSEGKIIGSPIDVRFVEAETASDMGLSIDSDAEPVNTEIFNIRGQRVANVRCGEKPELASGMYIFRHTMPDGTVKTEKKTYR